MAAEVVSSNIVGYNKVTLSNTFTIIGSQFLNVGAETKDIQELLEANNDLVGLDADHDYAVQTELRVWTGTGYNTYGWDAEGDPEVAGSDHKWVVPGDLTIASFDIPVGSAVWIKTPAEKTVTLAGEVPSGDTQEVSISAGFNLIANPFPVEMSIQSIQLDDTFPGLDADHDYAIRTELRVWTGTGYSTFGWDPEGDPEVAGSDHKWVTPGDLAILDTKIPVGSGFWIKSEVSGTITFTK